MGSRGNWLFDLRAPCLTIQSEFRVDESTDFGLYHLTRELAAELPARTPGSPAPASSLRQGSTASPSRLSPCERLRA
jgi:hypothetical protein